MKPFYRKRRIERLEQLSNLLEEEINNIDVWYKTNYGLNMDIWTPNAKNEYIKLISPIQAAWGNIHELHVNLINENI